MILGLREQIQILLMELIKFQVSTKVIEKCIKIRDFFQIVTFLQRFDNAASLSP